MARFLTSELKRTTNDKATGAILKIGGKARREYHVTIVISVDPVPHIAYPLFPLVDNIMVEVVRNNFEDVFPEIKEAIEESAFVGM